MTGLAATLIGTGISDEELGAFIHGSAQEYELYKQQKLAEMDAPVEDAAVGLADMLTTLATPLAIPAKIAGKKGGKMVAKKLSDLYSKAEPKHLTIKTTASGRYEGPMGTSISKHPTPREVQHAVNEDHVLEKAFREYDKYIKNQGK